MRCLPTKQQTGKVSDQLVKKAERLAAKEPDIFDGRPKQSYKKS